MLEVSGLTGTVSAELQNTLVLPAREASMFKGAGTSWWLVFGERVTSQTANFSLLSIHLKRNWCWGWLR